MKKLLYLFLCLFIFSCDNDDTIYNEEVTYRIECIVHDDSTSVNLSGAGLPGGGKDIKKYYIQEVKFIRAMTNSWLATCDDSEVLVTLKLYDLKNKLIQEKSGNNRINIEIRR